MKETLKLAIILFLITAVSTGILAVVNNFTSAVIAERQAEELKAGLSIVSPEADEFQPIDDGDLATAQTDYPMVDNMYEALSGGNVIGYVFEMTAKGGYAGDINLILGIDNATQEITGFQVLEHGESPGFGALAAEPEFAEGTIGATNADEIQGISGATKTTDAIKGAITEAYGAMDLVGQTASLPSEYIFAIAR